VLRARKAGLETENVALSDEQEGDTSLSFCQHSTVWKRQLGDGMNPMAEYIDPRWSFERRYIMYQSITIDAYILQSI